MRPARRRELGRALNLRSTPELSFVRDDSIDKGGETVQIARQQAGGVLVGQHIGGLAQLPQGAAQPGGEIAVPLYVAIATDCGCFVYANTTPHTHRAAAALMEQSKTQSRCAGLGLLLSLRSKLPRCPLLRAFPQSWVGWAS